MKRLHRREEGAVAIIVALLLVVLMGAVALAVDVGGLVLRRREMVNGADAAALAAAQSCADAAFGSPNDMAMQYATKNVPATDSGLAGGILPALTVGCDTPGTSATGHVTVQFSSNQSLYFAPVLGFHHTSEVTTQATASWGGAGGGSPIPLVFSNLKHDPDVKCRPPLEAVGQICTIWYANAASAVPSFGFLNFDTWPKSPNHPALTLADLSNCNNSYGIAPDLYGNGVENLGDLNYPDPSWICAYKGNGTWQNRVPDASGTCSGIHYDGFTDYVEKCQPEHGLRQSELFGIHALQGFAERHRKQTERAVPLVQGRNASTRCNLQRRSRPCRCQRWHRRTLPRRRMARCPIRWQSPRPRRQLRG